MTATVEVRGFRGDDVPELVGTWRRSAPLDPIDTGRFRRQVLLDANFDPAGLRVAVHGGRIVGAAHAVRRRVPMTGTDLEPEQGWIPFFFVDPAVRRRGLGRRLLTDALAWLRELGRTRVDFAAYTPHYFVPGVDAQAYPEAYQLLRSLGFRTRCEAVAMYRELAGYRPPEDVLRLAASLEERGFRLGTPRDGDLVELLRLAEEEFSPDWARAIRDCLAAGAPLERIVTAHAPGGRPAGWAMHGAYEAVAERFGPFGVAAGWRGTGLGLVLLHLTLERMRAQGAQSAWFLWTSQESAAGRLYRKAGFTVTRTFQVMRREEQ